MGNNKVEMGNLYKNESVEYDDWFVPDMVLDEILAQKYQEELYMRVDYYQKLVEEFDGI